MQIKLRPIPGYEDRYKASTDGRIWTNKNKKFLRPGPSSGGYLDVVLVRDGKNTTKKVHKLVALTFHGPAPIGHYVCHMDGNRNNNHANNLKYGSPAENSHHKKWSVPLNLLKRRNRGMHPGVYLGMQIRAWNIPLRYASQNLHVSVTALRRLVRGEVPLTADLAVRLAKWIPGDPEAWLRAQALFDLRQVNSKILPHISPLHINHGEVAHIRL